jgi:hypothetical protein
MNPSTKAVSPRSRLEQSLKQELRRMQRRALLAGAATPAERERMGQLRDTIKRMDAERFAAR